MEKYQINWVHFTLEERKLIEKIIQQGEYTKITKLIVVSSKEQENEITKFIESVAPVGRTRESAVKAQIKMLRMKGEDPILTPEQEAGWQKQLDEEANPVRTAIAQETEKLKAELTKLKISFPSTASYEQLKGIKEQALETQAAEEVKTPEVVELPVVESEGVAHILTSEDLEANPELKDEGLKVGDEIQLPEVPEAVEKPKGGKSSGKSSKK